MYSHVSRRTFLLGTGAAATLLLAGCSSPRDPISTAGTLDFANPLSVPPLAPSTVASDGTKVFKLTAEAGSSRFLPGGPTPTWGYNGAFLGPTLRARRGETVRVAIQNALEEPTTVHWHGMHLPAIYDGGPHQVIAPGDEFAPEWTLDQPAATLWYHPHVHKQTEEQMTRGLAGMFIVDDDGQDLGLPIEYGVDDIPLILQDRAFEDDLAFKMTSDAQTGLLGDTMLINGTVNPHLAVTTETVRFRLLNAATARVFNFGFSDNREFTVIGSDGGLLPAPVGVERLLLSPGERAEIVVRFRPGEQPVLKSFPQELGMSEAFNNEAGGNDILDLLQFRAAAKLSAAPGLPPVLATLEPPALKTSVATRSFILKGMYINGKLMDMSRIDAAVGAGTTEIWNVSNTDSQPHNFHVHGVQFRILEINGAEPGPEFSGWKDTVFLPVRASARIALTFGRYADPATAYMYHCHFIRHADHGMMGQFTVIET
ncbi:MULTISPECIES: multicopper oxidase domain-containing protein [Micrococcaceae]|uniref:Multicopper oxidase CueO n=3 Tax=Micrococcaceae TaxID=1268 RepID=Q6SK89_PAEAU|nr:MULTISPECIES: multicopper oxidase domain-containing protein [Micrococcaceae]AAS20083.1 oxidase [Paenarthrobacter aurescens]ABM10474.1 putative Multicopper oxidase family protein [Paenarthrobacter aurescens TC1]SDQ03240.1 cell division protein SufI [Arthrobacter crystallopoietes]